MAERIDERGGREYADPAKASHRHRMPGNSQQRTEYRRFDLVPRIHQWRNSISVLLAVGSTQLLGGGLNRAVNHDGFTWADRMSERGYRVDPTQSVLLQGKLAKEG
jgi:hypothetical protein